MNITLSKKKNYYFKRSEKLCPSQTALSKLHLNSYATKKMKLRNL